jgi:hypothetical protein
MIDDACNQIAPELADDLDEEPRGWLGLMGD